MSKKGGAGKKWKNAGTDEDLNAILAQLAMEHKARAENAGAKKGKAEKKGGKNAVVLNGGRDAVPAEEEAPKVPKVLDWHEEVAAMKPVDEPFPGGEFPVGQRESYYLIGKDGRVATVRESNLEKKALDSSFEHMYQDYRLSADVHRQVRSYVKSWVTTLKIPTCSDCKEAQIPVETTDDESEEETDESIIEESWLEYNSAFDEAEEQFVEETDESIIEESWFEYNSVFDEAEEQSEEETDEPLTEESCFEDNPGFCGSEDQLRRMAKANRKNEDVQLVFSSYLSLYNYRYR